MTTRFFTGAALALLAAGAPAMADSAAPGTAQPAAKADDGDQNKTVCHRIEAIGTRLGTKKVCRTKSEWDAQQAADRMDLERSQTQRQGKDG